MRVSPDVAPEWETRLSKILGRRRYLSSTRNAIRNSLNRLYLNNRWWVNDPDCLLLRREQGKLSQEEVLALATAVALTRGLVFVSDPVEKIPPDRLRILNQVRGIISELEGGEVRVIDLMEQKDPEIIATRGLETDFLAVFNLKDLEKERLFDLEEIFPGKLWPAHLVEYWSQKASDIKEGKLHPRGITPHSVRFFRIQKE